MGDPRWVLNLTLPVRGLITPKPATWLEDVFWGRRNVLSVSWGDLGSVAFYPLYHEHRESIVHLAREYSRLLVSFPDADHLRIEGIEPAGATRRGSRLRAATETVTLPLSTVDPAPQVLKVSYAYYRGVFAWRPVLISLGLLILGNLTGLWMVSGEVRRLARSRLRLGRGHGGREPTLTSERLAEIKPGQSTYDDVVRLCGMPDEQHRRASAGERYTLVYRATHRRPERGATVYLPQVHQILPRVARLMVALRAELLGARREECSFLFLVEGHGRAGMGLHHDGEVDAFWLQLEGRRTVTLGPPVAPRTRLDLPQRRDTGSGWRTLDLPPGSLLHLPPRTPHDVVCHGRSLALSLTWSRRPTPPPRVAWDVASGRAKPMPRRDPRWLWTQVPVTAGGLDRARRRFRLRTPEGAAWLPARTRRLAARLVGMPAVAADAPAAAPLVALALLAPEDLPLVLVPDAPRALDGWRFA